MLSQTRTQLLPCSVHFGASHASLVAWPDLPVKGLVQRFLSNCGLDIDPDAVELHLDRYLLPATSRFGTVLARWHRSVDTHDVVRLKALVPRHPSGKARVKLDARGPPLHTVRQVAGRAVAAMAMPAGPTRLQSTVSAAADICLLPYTFTNWTEAWEHSLMKVAVLLFRTLLPGKPGAAGSVLQACSDLLDLPSAFAPRGHLYQGLCAMQLHIYLLQAANELKATGLAAGSAPGPAPWPAPTAAASPATSEAAGTGGAEAASGCRQPCRGPSCSRGGRTAPCGSCSSSKSITIGGCSGGGGIRSSGTRAREARQREVTLETLKQLLAKAAARVGAVLEQLSYYGSELNNLLDSYSPPPAEQLSGPYVSSGGGDAAAGKVSHPATSRNGSRDLRLEVAELLEPYAAMQLLEAFGRMAVACYATAAPPPLLPPGTLPFSWDCHRNLFHVILDLGAQAGIGSRAEWSAVVFGGRQAEDDLPTTYGSVELAPAGAGPTLELPLVASMLDALLQLHVQAHSQCTSGAGKAAAAAASGRDESDDGSSDDGTRCCPRTPAVSQLPPCLDWLQDVTSVLEAACDVYALAGGGGSAAEADAEAELQPASAASALASAAVDADGDAAATSAAAAAAAAMAAATPVAAAAAALPISAMASATMAAAVGAAAIAAVAAVESTRLGDTAPPPPSDQSGQPLLGGGGGAAATTSTLHASSSPGPSAGPRTSQLGARAAGCSGGTDEPSHRDFDSSLDAGGRSLVQLEADDDPSGPSELPSPKAAVPMVGAVEGDAAAGAEAEEAASSVPQLAAEITAPAAAAAVAAAAAAVVVAVATAGSAVKAGAAVAAPATPPAAAVAAASAAAAGTAPMLLSARLMVVDALHRALQCPCLVEQLLAGGLRAGELCERAVWRHPRLASCAPAAAYYKQALDNLLKPLSYVYDEDDYDAPVVYVDRKDMLGSSFASLMDIEDFLDHGGICVKFEDEEAYGDGVLREWLTEIAASLFDPNAGLFRLCDGDVRALHLSPAGSQQEDQLELLRFAGRVIGLAMRARVPLGFHLSTALFKMLQQPGPAGRGRLNMADLAQLEPRLAATCGQIAAASDVEALGLTFVASCGHLGLAHELSLLPGGAGEDVAVTVDNRRDYLDRLVRFYCSWGCSSHHGKTLMNASGTAAKVEVEVEVEGGGSRQHPQPGGGDWDRCELDAVTWLAQGLAESLFRLPDSDDEDDRVEMLAARLRSISAGAFNSRLGGEVGAIDVEAWRNHTSAPAFKNDRERVVLRTFWDVVSELSADEQRRLLQFWTGISHLPAGGFKHLSQQLQLVPARPGEDCFGGGGGGAARVTYDAADADDSHEGSGPTTTTATTTTTTITTIPTIPITTATVITTTTVTITSASSSNNSVASGGADDSGGGGGEGGSGDDGGGSGAAAAAAAPEEEEEEDMGSGGSDGNVREQQQQHRSEDHPAAAAAVGLSVSGGGASGSDGGTAEAEVEGDDAAGRSGVSNDSRGGSNGSGGGTSAIDGGRDGGGDIGATGDGAAAASGGGGGEGNPVQEQGHDEALRSGHGGDGAVALGPALLAAHTCFFQLRLPLLSDKAAMREAVVESLANLGAFWNE